MVSNFLLPWSRLNLFSLSSEIPLEAATYFEYGKIEEVIGLGSIY